MQKKFEVAVNLAQDFTAEQKRQARNNIGCHIFDDIVSHDTFEADSLARLVIDIPLTQAVKDTGSSFAIHYHIELSASQSETPSPVIPDGTDFSMSVYQGRAGANINTQNAKFSELSNSAIFDGMIVWPIQLLNTDIRVEISFKAGAFNQGDKFDIYWKLIAFENP